MHVLSRYSFQHAIPGLACTGRGALGCATGVPSAAVRAAVAALSVAALFEGAIHSRAFSMFTKLACP